MQSDVEPRRSLESLSSLSKKIPFFFWQIHYAWLFFRPPGDCLLEVLVNGADGIGVGWSTFVPMLVLPQKTVKL